MKLMSEAASYHGRRLFKEGLALLKKHRVAYEERYLREWSSAVPSGLSSSCPGVPNAEALG